MAGSPTPVLRQVIRTVARGDPPDVTDRELLYRFARDTDQAAFAALVRRHTNMVLGVCRRLLPTVQDAEDAVQATFLVLAQKARGGRWHPSVANWLYTTARRVARNARVVAQRRARRERRAAVPEVIPPVDRMTGRELLAALDEELDRLPPRYREPLVLCYLEGLTRDEAAARLDIPAATLRTHLDRGRKRLHDALTKGGCALGAGLLALAVTSPAGASPPRLIQAVLAAASGSTPAAVAELAKGVAVNAMMNRAVLALAAMIAVAALGIGIGSLKSTAAGQPADPPAVPDQGQAKDEKPAPEAPKDVTISGRVLDPDGKPLAGAKLLLLGKGDKPVELGTSGTGGRFQVEVPADGKDLSLVARAEGVGIDFLNLGNLDPTAEVELRTVKDNAVRGRVVDTQGKPAVGMKVVVTHLGVFAGNSLDPLLAEWKKMRATSGQPMGVKQLAPGKLFAAATDSEGRFVLPGVGAERLVGLHFSGAGAADTALWVANRPGLDPKPYNDAVRNNDPRGFEVFGQRWFLEGPDLSVVAEAEKPIRGVVKDVETGKGRPGVEVRLTQTLLVTTKTDADGRYELHGARKAKSYKVEVPSDPVAAYMPSQAQVADTAGYEPITADIGVKKGVVVTGKVIDAATRKVLPGFAMIGTLNDNPSVKEYPEFSSSGWLQHSRTDQDDTFRVVTVPGPVLLMGGPDVGRMPDGWVGQFKYKPAVPDPKYPQYFDNQIGGYYGLGGGVGLLQGNFCKVLEIKPGAGVVEQDILVEPAPALPVKIRDADGKPLAGALVTGIADAFPPVPCETDSCAAYNLTPGKPRLMVFYEPRKKLFGTLALKGDEKDEVVVKLGPGGAVKGRLLDENGRPLAGVGVSVFPRERNAAEMHNHVHRARPVETDADGRFQVDEVVPGVKFVLSFRRGQRTFETVAKPEDMTAKPGSVLDAGDVKVK